MTNRLLALTALAAFTYLFFANAWVGDDAYITFRTIDNFVHGYGLRWNVHERVQVFTHPLWMLLCSIVYFFTREFYYSVVALSFVVCVAGFLAHWRILGWDEKWKAAALVSVLTTSKTFMDFSSSGLENCLGAFWAVLFILAWRDRSSPHTIWKCVSIAAAAYITRQDTVLLYVCACVYLVATRRAQTSGWVRQVIAGATPALAWTISRSCISVSLFRIRPTARRSWPAFLSISDWNTDSVISPTPPAGIWSRSSSPSSG